MENLLEKNLCQSLFLAKLQASFFTEHLPVTASEVSFIHLSVSQKISLMSPMLGRSIWNILMWTENTCIDLEGQEQAFSDVLQNRKIGVLKNVMACNVIKKRLQHMCFPVKFAKFLRRTFFKEHLWWLLLEGDC